MSVSRSVSIAGQGALTATAEASKFTFNKTLSGHGMLTATAARFFDINNVVIPVVPLELRVSYLNDIQTGTTNPAFSPVSEYMRILNRGQ